MNKYKILGGGVIAMIFAGVMVLLLSDALFEDSKVTTAKKVARHYLKYPDSAKFKGPYKFIYANTFGGSGKALAICGKVKAKNSVGDYLGFHNFIVYGQEFAVMDLSKMSRNQKYDLFKCIKFGTEL